MLKIMFAFLLPLIFLSFGSTCWAARAKNARRTAVPVTANVQITRDGQPVPLLKPASWGFVEVAPGVKAYFARVLVRVPEGKGIASVSGAGVKVKPEWIRPDKILIAIGAMNSELTIRYDDASEEKWTSQITLSGTMIVANGCDKVGLRVVSEPANPPIFFAAECSTKADRIVFNASVPADMDWDVTSIFETDGKGERWKVFEISRNTRVAGNDVVATLGFVKEGKKFSFLLMQDGGKTGTPAPAKKEKKRSSRIRLDFGLAQLSAQTSVASASGVGPFVGGQWVTSEAFWKLRGLVGGRYVFPLAGGSAYEFSGGLGKVFGQFAPEVSTFGVFGEYAAIGHSHENSGKLISLQHNQFGVAGLWSLPGKTSGFSAVLRYSGLGGDSTNMGLSLAYEGFMKSSNKWGAVFHYSGQSAKSTSGTSKFSQMALGASITY